MAVTIYQKKFGEPDSAFFIRTDIDDKIEEVTGLEPDTTYVFKKVETGKPDITRYVKTLPANPDGGTPYTLPIATDSILGGIKVGTGLTIDPVTGVLSASTTTGSGIPYYNPATPYQYGVEPTLVKWAVDGNLRVWTLKDTANTQALETRAAPSYAPNSQWVDVGLDVLDTTGLTITPYEQNAFAAPNSLISDNTVIMLMRGISSYQTVWDSLAEAWNGDTTMWGLVTRKTQYLAGINYLDATDPDTYLNNGALRTVVYVDQKPVRNFTFLPYDYYYEFDLNLTIHVPANTTPNFTWDSDYFQPVSLNLNTLHAEAKTYNLTFIPGADNKLFLATDTLGTEPDNAATVQKKQRFTKADLVNGVLTLPDAAVAVTGIMYGDSPAFKARDFAGTNTDYDFTHTPGSNQITFDADTVTGMVAGQDGVVEYFTSADITAPGGETLAVQPYVETIQYNGTRTYTLEHTPGKIIEAQVLTLTDDWYSVPVTFTGKNVTFPETDGNGNAINLTPTGDATGEKTLIRVHYTTGLLPDVPNENNVSDLVIWDNATNYPVNDPRLIQVYDSTNKVWLNFKRTATALPDTAPYLNPTTDATKTYYVPSGGSGSGNTSTPYTLPDASTEEKGGVLLSVDPEEDEPPVAVGVNDPILKQFRIIGSVNVIDDTIHLAFSVNTTINAVTPIVLASGAEINTVTYLLNGTAVTPTFPYTLPANNRLSIVATFLSGKTSGNLEITGTE